MIDRQALIQEEDKRKNPLRHTKYSDCKFCCCSDPLPFIKNSGFLIWVLQKNITGASAVPLSLLCGEGSFNIEHSEPDFSNLDPHHVEMRCEVWNSQGSDVLLWWRLWWNTACFLSAGGRSSSSALWWSETPSTGRWRPSTAVSLCLSLHYLVKYQLASSFLFTSSLWFFSSFLPVFLPARVPAG